MAIKVANLYQLGTMNGQVDKDQKKLIQEKVKVTTDWIKQVNDNYKDTMKLYEVDEKATEEYHIRSELHNQIVEEYRKAEEPLPGAKEINKEVDRRRMAMGEEDGNKPLVKMNKEELISEAEKEGIELDGSEKKADLIQKLENKYI